MIFREREIMVIRGWPVPEAVRKKAGKEEGEEWELVEPNFRLVRPYRRSRKREAKPAAEMRGDEQLKKHQFQSHH